MFYIMKKYIFESYRNQGYQLITSVRWTDAKDKNKSKKNNNIECIFLFILKRAVPRNSSLLYLLREHKYDHLKNETKYK